MLAPALLLALSAAGCGGGGGTADPRQIADAVLDDFRSEDFTSIAGYYPSYMAEMGEQHFLRGDWRLKEGWDKWKPLKDSFTEGDMALDPKDKSGITETQEKWMAASAEQRFAVREGFYRIYSADEWEKRLKESEWYWTDRSVDLDTEGEGTAEFQYRNNYRDRLTVSLMREGGLWYLRGVSFRFDKEMEKKPSDD